MKIIGELKKQVAAANNKDEARRLIKGAGFLLSDAELEMVTGGIGSDTLSGGEDDALNDMDPFHSGSRDTLPDNGGNSNVAPDNGSDTIYGGGDCSIFQTLRV